MHVSCRTNYTYCMVLYGEGCILTFYTALGMLCFLGGENERHDRLNVFSFR